MSINLLHHVSNKITDATISKLSGLMGMETEATDSAVSNILPTLLKAIVSRADTADETSALRGFIRTNNIASNVATDFLNLDRESTMEYQDIGKRAIQYLFGGAEESLMQSMSEKSGLEIQNTKRFAEFLTPLALGHVSKFGNRENLTDVQFSAYLKSQKENLMNPEERKQIDSSKSRRSSEEKTNDTPIAAAGLLKFLIPLLALLGLFWWISQKACASQDAFNKTEQTIKTTDIVTSTNQGKSPTATTKNTWSVNEDGDLEDAKGTVVKKAGEFSVTDGYYVSTSGEPLSPVYNPLNKSSDEFKKNFSDILMTKKSVGTTYVLSHMEFDPQSNTVTKHSKAELEGLANALRTIPGAKIQVEVHSVDGDDETKLRAQAIKDLLVSLGVEKDQISSKGMGAQIASKAASHSVEIRVKQVK